MLASNDQTAVVVVGVVVTAVVDVASIVVAEEMVLKPTDKAAPRWMLATRQLSLPSLEGFKLKVLLGFSLLC